MTDVEDNVFDLLGLHEALRDVYEAKRAAFADLVGAWDAEALAWERLPVTVDAYGLVTVGRWGGYLLQIDHMFTTDRVVLTPEGDQTGYDHGWCYPRGLGAVLALLMWDPAVEAEPSCYVKRATPRPRRAGETAARWLP